MFINFLSEFLVWFFLFLPVYFLLKGKHELGFYMSACLVSSWLIGLIVKEFFYLPRPVPFKLLDGTFPSSHSSVSFAVATGLFVTFGRRSWWIFIFAVLVAVGRILSGAHFTLDVVGGALFGIILALLLKLVNFKQLLRKKH